MPAPSSGAGAQWHHAREPSRCQPHDRPPPVPSIAWTMCMSRMTMKGHPCRKLARACSESTESECLRITMC
eukprot:1177419-Prorocentrum_minimum.AAC.1